MRREKDLALLAAAALVVFAAGAAVSATTLTFEFTHLTADAGRSMVLRAVDADTWVEIARVRVSPVPVAAFRIDVASFVEGHAYRIDYFVDRNDNGAYDAPPVDGAWRWSLPSVAGSSVVVAPQGDASTDIAWPPAFDAAIGEGEYRHTLTDAATGIRLDWQNDAQVLYIGLTAPGTGWVGIGIDPESRMQGANYILAAVEDGTLAITDEFGVSGVTHRTDAQTNIIQAAGREVDGKTVVEFAIALVTGDAAEDKPLAPGQSVTVLLAMNQSQDSFSARHTARSTLTIALDGVK